MRSAQLLILSAVLFSSVLASAATLDLAQMAGDIRRRLENPSILTPQSCVSVLNAMIDELANAKSANLERADVASSAHRIVSDLWASRLAVRKALVEFHEQGVLTPPCVSAVRNAFRNFRFYEEYAGVHSLPPGVWVKPSPSDVFSGGFPSVVMKPGLKAIEIRTGDVLVSYGMAYGSAAIAHVGEDGGTFSHMAMIHVDDATGVAYTVEAHPEVGVKVAPVDKYLHDGKGRSALFRFQDAVVSAAAARLVFEIVKKAEQSGKTIPYDFTMNLEDPTKLFCTEVVKYAFELASRKLAAKIQMPMFPTKITMRNTYVLDAFGIKSRVTFAPSDIEVDPRFEMIAEWRDLARVRLMHHQQAALQMEFKWLDSLDYKYFADLRTILQSGVLWSVRHLPLFSNLIDQLVPPDLSAKTLQAVVGVYLVSEDIHDALIARDVELEKSGRVLMPLPEILRQVETLRVRDLKAYRRYKDWVKYDQQNSEMPGPPSDQWHWLLRARTEL